MEERILIPVHRTAERRPHTSVGRVSGHTAQHRLNFCGLGCSPLKKANSQGGNGEEDQNSRPQYSREEAQDVCRHDSCHTPEPVSQWVWLLTSEEEKPSGNNGGEHRNSRPQENREESQYICRLCFRSNSINQPHCLWAGLLTSKEGEFSGGNGREIPNPRPQYSREEAQDMFHFTPQKPTALSVGRTTHL